MCWPVYVLFSGCVFVTAVVFEMSQELSMSMLRFQPRGRVRSLNSTTVHINEGASSLTETN